MEKYFIGIDNGGTVIKAAVYDVRGTECAVSSARTEIFSPSVGYAERDMEALWLSNCTCIHDVLDRSGIYPASVAGIAVCGHGKGLYPWGVNEHPAGMGIMSTDNRAWECIETWKNDGTWRQVYPKICQALLPSQPVALLAWLKTHALSEYQSIKWVFSVKDYIRFRLTGEAYSEVTDLSGTALMNIRDVCIDTSILADFGIPEAAGMIPPLKRSYELCGTITKEAAALTGLFEGTPVAGGMFDIDSSALAMHVTEPGRLCVITGTWSINECLSPEPVLNTNVAMNSLFVIPNYYLLEECSPTSAGNLEWFIRNNMQGIHSLEGDSLYDHIDRLVASIMPQESHVCYLPFIYGSNAHPLARAAFIGLTSFHTLAHQLRAIYEGVVFSHRTHIDRLQSATPPKHEAVRLAGGAVNSPVWVQMFADVLNRPIETVQGVKELGALGCAITAAVATGVYRSYGEAVNAMVRVNPPIESDRSAHEIYEHKYRSFVAIREVLDTMWDRFKV
jgi:L-xylulokinase